MTRADRISAVQILVGVLVLAVSARISVPIPGAPVPQSLQTLAVVLIGAGAGAKRGGICISLYVLAGMVGAPVFADGAAGWSHASGSSAGYLVGFLLAAVSVGYLRETGRLVGVVRVFGVMIGAHLLILSSGWVRLGFMVGPGVAWDSGVAPFLFGGVAKAAAATAFVVLWHSRSKVHG